MQGMKGWICIENLELRVVIGTWEEERQRPQTIYADIEYRLDIQRAVETDRLEGTLDYEGLSRRLREAVSSTRFFLLESLAFFIFRLIYEEDLVEEVVVSVRKRVDFADMVCVKLSSC
ncbi:MAG: dihydroneopterin aldolase [Planctomycetota bacterium]|nr:MAG: dihydroneopterin aldolase [Planctomycetota bacterium]